MAVVAVVVAVVAWDVMVVVAPVLRLVAAIHVAVVAIIIVITAVAVAVATPAVVLRIVAPRLAPLRAVELRLRRALALAVPPRLVKLALRQLPKLRLRLPPRPVSSVAVPVWSAFVASR